ncbi:two-component transcriptional regulator, LuxR family protein [Oscillochloris trichoides DG-6]|uniref:Two-component transcriptional regulator, LuxR family protein n=1 Tax=Oscillochloris trichoides DG-6 TaxID=765420 RepID=E1IH13_9CHLR|nr:two-component transcriptional regulator, LuxR family protein [Oscillochloris trichoides DG-6]
MVLREGLKTLIAAQPDIEVVGEAESGDSAWAQIEICQPDVITLDISMPHGDGIQTMKRIKEAYPWIHVLILSVHDDASNLRQALAAGASGYILKSTAANALIQAIRIVAANGFYLDPLLTPHVVSQYVQRSPATTNLLGSELSEREREVVQRVVEGYSNKDIALQLNLSIKTVETYRARALDKLGLSGRAELVRYAIEQGWMNR